MATTIKSFSKAVFAFVRQAGPMGRPLLILAFWASMGGLAFAQNAKKPKNKMDMAKQAEDTFLDGIRADMLGNTEKAIYYYERALEDAPGSAAIHYKLAEMQARQGRYKEAQYFAAKAVELDEANEYYVRMLAVLYSQNNEHGDAIKLLQKSLKTKPEQADYYELMAAEYLKSEKPDDALKTLDRAEKQLGNSPELARQRQLIYLKQNKLDAALKEAKKLVVTNPEEPEYLLNLAELYLSNNKNDEATKLLEDNRALLEGMPSFSLLQLQLALRNGNEKEAKRYLISALSSPEMELEDKIAYLIPYLRSDKQDTTELNLMLDALQSAHRDQARVYFLRGDFNIRQNKMPEARVQYLRGLMLDKNNYGVWEQVSQLDLQMNQTDSLSKHSDLALELFPNAAVLWFYNGWAHYIQKDNAKAVRSFERARKLKPANAEMEKEVLSLLGDLYHTQKAYDKSDEAYGQALGLDSLNVHVLNNYSYYLSLREQKLDLAAKLGAKLMMLAPNESTYQDTYGWILFKKGDYAQAVVYLEKAAQPDASGVIFEHYGDALYKVGKLEQALAAWKTAQQKGGDVTPKLSDKIRFGKYVD